MKLFYAGSVGSGYGWGTFGTYITRELRKMGLLAEKADDIADICLMPLADHDFNCVSISRARINCAICFFEYPLGPKAAENATKYDVVFCGSTWCLERMKEKGITNGKVLIQGVDQETFKPQAPSTRETPSTKEFRIFSGGKFEHRKGQDIVIAAVRELLQKGTKVKLVTAWWNPWPSLIPFMFNSPHIGPVAGNYQREQTKWFEALLEANGIPAENFEVHGRLSQHELAAVMNSTDLGVFPNRCEGGTNLVLMEYMACGKPAVVSHATGHLDILNGYNAQPMFSGMPKESWCEPEIDDVVDAIETLMDSDFYRNKIANRGLEHIKQFTWERAARQIVETVSELCEAKLTK